MLDDVDAVIVNVAGCGAMLKDYGHHWHDDRSRTRERFAAKVKDINEFLDRARPGRRRRARSISRPPITTPAIWGTPRRFARRRGGCWPRFPGLKLVRLARDRAVLRRGRHLQPDRAGNGRPAQPPQARQHPSTGARAVVTANAGCLLQIAREARGPRRNDCGSRIRSTCSI